MGCGCRTLSHPGLIVFPSPLCSPVLEQEGIPHTPIRALWKETDKWPLLAALMDLYESPRRDGTAQTKTNNCTSQSTERWRVRQLPDCTQPHSARLLKLTITPIHPVCLQLISLTLLCFCSRQQPTLQQRLLVHICAEASTHLPAAGSGGKWHGLFAPLCPLQKRK